MNKERVLITGGSGLLGSNAARMLCDRYDVYATYKTQPSKIDGCHFTYMDVCNRDQALSIVTTIRPQLIIHTSGLANVDACEVNEADAFNINVDGTDNIAIASQAFGAKLVYISTDSVFDGTKGGYTETDTTEPLNIYAESKLIGESRVQDIAPDSIIVRTAFYGHSMYGNSGLAGWILDNILRGKCIHMFTDAIFTPIYVDNLTDVIMSMYHNNLSGLYHVGGSEACSKYHFGRVIADAFGFNKELVRPISIDEAQFVATRPKNVSLNTDKVQKAQGVRLMDVRAGVLHLRKGFKSR